MLGEMSLFFSPSIMRSVWVEVTTVPLRSRRLISWVLVWDFRVYPLPDGRGSVKRGRVLQAVECVRRMVRRIVQAAEYGRWMVGRILRMGQALRCSQDS